MMLALASFSVAGMAQSETPTEKYSVSTNSFWSNWFIQGNVTWSAFYATDPAGKHNGVLSAPFHKFPTGEGYTGLGASLAIGKWFTPGIGLRTKLNAWRAGSKYTETYWTSAGIYDVEYKPTEYWTLNEQVLFNLNNLICGYNPDRFWNLIPYIGAGITRNMTARHYSTQLSAGILNTFRLSKHLAANLEVAWNNHENGDRGLGLKERGHQFNLEVGLTYSLGKACWKKAPDVEAIKALAQSQIDALTSQLADQQAENTRLQNVVATNQKAVVTEAKPKVVTEIVAAPVSVFFNLAQSKIASQKDLQNVKELAEIAKKKGSKLVVTGYADSKTGSAKLNQELSQKRADAVVNELVKMGVSRDNIEVVAAGGVNILTPVSYDRRATVAIK